MIESHIRPFFQIFIADQLARFLARALTANQVTLLSLVFGLIAAALLAYGFVLVATVALLLSGLCDVLDGTVARLRGESSAIGATYDIMADRGVEAAMLIGLYCVAPDDRGLVIACMFASVLICVTSFLMAAIVTPEHEGQKSFHYSPGLMERAEAFLFFIAMMWLPAYAIELGYAFVALVSYTGVKRLYEIRQHLAG